MTIVRAPNFIEEYRARAQSSDVNEITGRTGRRDLTAFVTARVLERLSLCPSDTLVDVGCGDASLLANASAAVSGGRFIGILPTAEELALVQATRRLDGISIMIGLAEATGLPPGSADKVVCNSVLHIVPDVAATLRELARIAKAGAVVFIGEVPKVDEKAGKRYGDSLTKWLIYVLRTRGISSFASKLRLVLRALLSSEPLVISPKTVFFIQPQAFIAMAERYGLRLIESFPHPEITSAGTIYESPTRVDYLFRRQ
jgi:ubiquinone/menaquinone biosynthesis C-methylase UbiE